MSLKRMVAVVFILIGIVGIAYGGFNFPGNFHKEEIGSTQMIISEKQYINVPAWAGVMFVLVGGVLLGMPRRA